VKTPISYYGGKQTLASIILALIPEHRIYCEPFLGGAAIFFAKKPSKVEIINDTNGELTNFYKVCKNDFRALKKEITISLHSRAQHHQAEVVYNNPEMFDRIKRAWAVWMLANSSYGGLLDSGFGYDCKGMYSKKLDNKRTGFMVDYATRLQRTRIECCDALQIIKSCDALDAFFYLDPPYVGADQGHYDGYTQEDFCALLKLLSAIKGKFLLSSYRNKILSEFTKQNDWHTQEIECHSSMTSRSKTPRKKIEVLTANYPIRVILDKNDKKEEVAGQGI
jgi:DNA adenine methylase